MLENLLISLFTTLVVGPIQAELKNTFVLERAPAEIVAQVNACVIEAPRALSARAVSDPVWAISSVVGVWAEVTTPESLLRQAVPGCAPALEAAQPYLAKLRT